MLLYMHEMNVVQLNVTKLFQMIHFEMDAIEPTETKPIETFVFWIYINYITSYKSKPTQPRIRINYPSHYTEQHQNLTNPQILD